MCVKCRFKAKQNRKKYKCSHNKQQYNCKKCLGKQYCNITIVEPMKECHGSSICEHNRQKAHVKNVVEEAICEHNRPK